MKAVGSLIDTAYLYIKNEFIYGEILPGTLLSENDIALQLGISRTPVRHAISRLESEGLVQPLKKRGVLVKEISFHEFNELAENILALMQYAALIVEREGFKEIEQLRGVYKLQVEATNNENYASYIQHGMAFNACFLSSIGNQSMLEALEKFQDKVILYGIMNYRKTPREPHFSATPLNGDILQALEQKNYEAVKRILYDYSGRIRQIRSIY